MDASGRRFSWTRFMLNAFPNFAHDAKDDVELSPQQADLLLIYQLSLPHPRYLGEEAFFHAGIATSLSYSRKTYKALLKHGLILPAPKSDPSAISPSSASTSASTPPLTVATHAITKAFASQQAHISVHAQRKLVGLLFFWEEECVRWNMLDAEERALRQLLAERPGDVDAEMALQALGIRRGLVPGKRAAEGMGPGDALPRYEGR